MSYEKPVVRDYGDVAEITAGGGIAGDVTICNSVDTCVAGIKQN